MARVKIIIYPDEDSNMLLSDLEKVGEAFRFRRIMYFFKYLLYSAKNRKFSIEFYGQNKEIEVIRSSGNCISEKMHEKKSSRGISLKKKSRNL